MRICATCGVEREGPLPATCPICADERQYVPDSGQRWLAVEDLSPEHEVRLREFEPGLTGLRAHPKVGIGHTALVATTVDGGLLWDPPAYVDDEAVAAVAALGRIRAVAASHPHMFGVQVEWSRALGGVPVLVNEADREWLGRGDPAVELWGESVEVDQEMTLHRVGGHFPGSAVALWRAGAEGRGVLLAGDAVAPNPDGRTLSFMWSYPNYIPLSGAVAQRIVEQLEPLEFDRVYANFGNSLESGAKEALRYSARRHAAWAGGEFDHLT
ncbi:hydrolase [Zhihengliuella salsuginis]|uniref:Hydrolase n=1 Tax=Zhihengliuella salsuginis TaxID=578222 RepID=A0ABQ3GFH3_9MICC|nr:hydrolase [Zhihengliuella salsuginis]GHD01967.1 hydrolase [Zhihengliuella salsuginis]